MAKKKKNRQERRAEAARQAEQEKKAAQKAAAKKNRKPNVFQRIGLFFKEVVVELKKVNWLTTDELVKSTSVVAGIVVAFTLLTWIADTGFGALAALFLGK